MPPTPLHRFNTQPPEGGCPDGLFIKLTSDVSTHSRPKAAAVILAIWRCRLDVSTHSRPKAAAAWDAAKTRQEVVSTHSRPKAAAMSYTDALLATLFQHTAARRRLLRNNQFRRLLRRFNTQPPEGGCVDLYQIEPVYKVSTHSRPKAAAARTTPSTPSPPGFNTQPPEGGCKVGITALPGLFCFNTQPPEGGCWLKADNRCRYVCFNTQPPEGGCLLAVPSLAIACCFNTQPPEGGCPVHYMAIRNIGSFNTQPPEGGCF